MENEILEGKIADREKDIDSAAATINRLKDALNEILEIGRDNESSIETLGKIERVAENALNGELFNQDNSDGAEIKLDRTTLPKDGQAVSFQTQDEDWHDGYFVDGDDLFWVNESTFYPAFDILKWKPN